MINTCTCKNGALSFIIEEKTMSRFARLTVNRRASEILGLSAMALLVMVFLAYGRRATITIFTDDPGEINSLWSPQHGAFFKDLDDIGTEDMPRDTVFDRRKDRVAKYCSATMNLTGKSVSTQEPVILIGQHKSFVYCAIAKCATRFWKEIGSLIEHGKNYTEMYEGVNKKYLSSLERFKSSHSPAEAKTFIETATSFTFVREPYERLFSAYIDKFFGPNSEFWTGEGRLIISTLRKITPPPLLSLAVGHDVTFAELVKFVLKHKANRYTIDRHFAPMHSRCNPCTTKLDYFGKLETFKDDARFIIDKISRGSGEDYSKILEMNQKSIISSVKGHMNALFVVFNNIDEMKYLDAEKVKTLKYQIFLRVWRKFQIRGELSVETEMPLSQDEVLKKNQSELQYLLLSAFDRPITADVTWQRRDALLQAYQTIPRDDLEALKGYLEADCELFGYVKEPKWLFGTSLATYKPIFDYFDTY